MNCAIGSVVNLGLVGSDVELRLADPSRNRFGVYGLNVYPKPIR